jgi:hypothetical protein
MKVDTFDNAKHEFKEFMFGWFQYNNTKEYRYMTHSKLIASELKMSRYMARKVLNHYVECGYFIKRTLGGGCNDYGDPVAPWNGYVMTLLGERYFSEVVEWG